MVLTAINGTSLGSGKGTIELQNNTDEQIALGTKQTLTFSVNVTAPTTEKGLIQPIGKSKKEHTLTLNEDIEPGKSLIINFNLPITTKKGVEITANVKSENETIKIPEIEEGVLDVWYNRGTH